MFFKQTENNHTLPQSCHVSVMAMAETAGTSNFDEFKGKDWSFVADWLKTKGLHKLCSVFEGV